MARAIWSGSISFGLLNVPVKLYSAVSKQTIRFRELREDDKSRVRHKRVAEEDGKEVPYEKIVKGYEITPDQYVILTRDDLEPIYFEHPYYLGPDKGAEKPYALLAKAMRDEHKVAIARFVLRNKEHLAAIRPMDGTLTLTTMRFADEVVPPDQLDGIESTDGRKLEKRELEMAKELIDSLTTDFDAEQYRDEYREELLALIERKAQGKAIVAQPSEEPKPTKAPDLMAALEDSLAAVRGEEPAEGAQDGAKERKPAKPASKAKSSGSKGRAKSKSKSSSSSRSKSGSGGRRKSPAKSR